MALNVSNPSLPKEQHSSSLLRLRAEDAEDMAVIAACLQDAVTRTADMAYLPRQHRFALVVSRYRWEAEAISGGGRKGGQQIRCGLRFDDVLKAEILGLDLRRRDQVLELLTIACEPGDGGAAALTLVFCGGPMVRLHVECIDCHLADMGEPWDTPRKPAHPIETGERPA